MITAVIATLTIAFLTLFMLFEGPNWVERFYGLLPEEKQPRWRAIGDEIYRTIGGYVTRQPGDQPDRRHRLDDRVPASSTCRSRSRSVSSSRSWT